MNNRRMWVTMIIGVVMGLFATINEFTFRYTVGLMLVYILLAIADMKDEKKKRRS